jgi:glutamine synthetase
VVCMTKPLAHTPGRSMHIHQSVVEQGSGQNIFSAADGQATPAFYQFIAGQQAAMADFTLLFAPHVNSYQRLCHPYASPNNACWSEDNRAAGLRIPASAPVARRVENRLPGADANPYLAIAASLAAGLYGIEQRLQPSAPIQGEFEVPDELALPCTMHAAIERLTRSSLALELFGKEFIEGYIATKTLELTSFLDEITPWERRVLAAHA